MYICNSYNLSTWDLPDIYIYIYFFPAFFNQATKRDRRLLLEETRAVYNL